MFPSGLHETVPWAFSIFQPCRQGEYELFVSLPRKAPPAVPSDESASLDIRRGPGDTPRPSLARWIFLFQGPKGGSARLWWGP